jgi:F5/8 type C domain/Fibronectin type III domain
LDTHRWMARSGKRGWMCLGFVTALTFTLLITPVVPAGAASPPDAPTNVSAVQGNDAATVSWTDPANDNGAKIDSYTVVASNSAGADAASAVCTGKSCSTLTLTDGSITGNLANGTAYTFEVYATNKKGNSPNSTASGSIVVGSPLAPTGVTARPGISSATISWTPSANSNGSAITGYTVVAYDSGGNGAAAAACTGSCTSLTMTDGSIYGNLVNGVAYTFEVFATNANGNSPFSVASASIVVGGAPIAPTNVSAIPGNNAATVTWTLSGNDNGPQISGYTVVAYTGGTSVAAGNCSSNTCSSVTLTNGSIYGTLNNGTAYTFQVYATNVDGNSPNSVASASIVVGAPVTPTGVTAVPAESSATVSWTASANNNGSAITGYTVVAYDASGNGAAAAACTGSCTSLTMTDGSIYGNLADGSAYTFEVFATNANGNSPYSLASAPQVIGLPDGSTDSCPQSVDVSSATASSTTSGFPASNVYDGNLGDFWSSNGHSTANNSESLAYWWSGGFKNVDEIQLYPRADSYGFPVDFTVYYSNGPSWEWAQTITNYSATPGQWNDIHLDQMVSANGIEIVAAQLSPDSYGNYYFQMAEVNAGCTSAIGNDADLADDATPQPNVSPANEQPNLALTSSAIMNRATTWLDSGDPVPYNEGEYWESPTDYWGDGRGDAPSPGGSPPAWREDCSGFVSYAWGFSDSDGGFTTFSFSDGDNQFTPNPYATLLPSWSDLQPGDALVYNGPELGDGTKNHMVLFAGWNGAPGASSFQIIQEGDSATGTYEYTFNMGDPVLSQFLPIRSVGFSTAPPPPPPSDSSQIVRNTNGPGYYILSPAGGVYAYGGAPFYGSADDHSYFSGETAVGMAVDAGGTGYWILSASGGVYAYGGAPYDGSASGQSYFNGQTAAALTLDASGNGYWILSRAGGVYQYGDAPFYGAAAGSSYFSGDTAVGLTLDASGKGYWMLSSAGGIYAYGDAPFKGAAAGSSYFDGDTAVGMVRSADGNGYSMLSSAGGVYAYGDGPFYGAAAGSSYFTGQTAISIATDQSVGGYWFVSNTGDVYAYGNAPYEGGGA